MSKSFEEFYRSLDHDYGDQQHQASFSRRMLRLQELEPCGRDHSRDVVEIKEEDGSKREIPWSTHTAKCYSHKVMDKVRREELS